MKFIKKFFQINDPKYWDMLSYAGSVGLQMVACIVVGLALGYWVDSKFDTKPWGVLGGLVFGIITGYRDVIRFARIIRRKHFTDDADKDGPKD